MLRRFLLMSLALVACFILATTGLAQNLAVNGSFETGDYTGWTRSGNLGATSITTGSAIVGTYGLHTGPVGSMGYISQTIATTPGDNYSVNWWLNNEGGTTNHATATWSGYSIADDTNLPTGIFWNFLRGGRATSTSSMLSFGFQNDPSYFRFDDVQVTLTGHQLLSLSSTGAGYVLVGQTGYSTARATNVGDANTILTGHFYGATGEFGSSATTSISAYTGSSTTRSYSYTPTARGYDSQTVLAATYGGAGWPTLSGQGVAPVNYVWKSSDAGLTRIGTTSTAYVGVQNVGDGNLSGLGSTSNLRGYGYLSSSHFYGYTNISLTDGDYTYLPFTYTPSSHVAESGTAYATFYNGNQNGTNTAQTIYVGLSGQGVGPIFASAIDGDPLPLYTAIDFGRVDDGDVASKLLEIGNTTTDPGGWTLTGLTLLNAVISGPDASAFSLDGFTPGGLIEAGNWLPFGLSFAALGIGERMAYLTFYTDQGAALGSSGQSFVFQLLGYAVPEPSTLIIWSLLGASGWLGLRMWPRRSRVRMAQGVSDPIEPTARQPWSPETRRAIYQVIERCGRPLSGQDSE